MQEHDEQRKGGIGSGVYPGVEEPIVDFLASPAIREEGQAAVSPFSLSPHLFPPENLIEVQPIPDPLSHGALTHSLTH